MDLTVLSTPFANKDTKLFLSRKVEKRLLASGQEAFPYEYSAFLAGTGPTITECFSLAQTKPELASFHWSGQAMLTVLKTIQQANLQWLGVLHTHPSTPPVPSLADAAGWHYPDLSYWILSLASAQPDLRLYQWTNDRFLEREFILVD